MADDSDHVDYEGVNVVHYCKHWNVAVVVVVVDAKESFLLVDMMMVALLYVKVNWPYLIFDLEVGCYDLTYLLEDFDLAYP